MDMEDPWLLVVSRLCVVNFSNLDAMLANFVNGVWYLNMKIPVRFYINRSRLVDFYVT